MENDFFLLIGSLFYWKKVPIKSTFCPELLKHYSFHFCRLAEVTESSFFDPFISNRNFLFEIFRPLCCFLVSFRTTSSNLSLKMAQIIHVQNKETQISCPLNCLWDQKVFNSIFLRKIVMINFFSHMLHFFPISSTRSSYVYERPKIWIL